MAEKAACIVATFPLLNSKKAIKQAADRSLRAISPRVILPTFCSTTPITVCFLQTIITSRSKDAWFQGPLRAEGGQRLLVTSPLDTTSDVLTIKDFGMGGSAPTTGVPTPHADGIIVDGWCNTVTIIKAYATAIEGHGYWFRNNIGALLGPGYVTLYGVESDFNAESAIFLESISGCRITDVQIEDSYNSQGIDLGEHASNVDIKGGQINDHGQNGLRIGGQRVTVMGVMFYANSNPNRRGTLNVSSGISLLPTARHVVITGCMTGPGNNTQKYGVDIAAGADLFVVQANDLPSNLTGGVNFSQITPATNHTIGGNIGQ